LGIGQRSYVRFWESLKKNPVLRIALLWGLVNVATYDFGKAFKKNPVLRIALLWGLV
jgi:hypothetical protein